MDDFVGCDDLREWLVSQGFKLQRDTLDRGSECNWLAYRKSAIDADECETNDGKRMQIVVRPHKMEIRGEVLESADVDVTGEAGGIWYSMKAYNLQHVTLRERLPQIEASLIAAWNALYRDKAGD